MHLKTAALVAALSSFAAFAPSASAALPPCVSVGNIPENRLTVCATAATNQDGTTVAPSARVDCSYGFFAQCAIDPVAVGKTGVEADPAYPAPEVDVDDLQVRSEGGTPATVYVNGTGVGLTHENFCAGADCATP